MAETCACIQEDIIMQFWCIYAFMYVCIHVHVSRRCPQRNHTVTERAGYVFFRALVHSGISQWGSD